MSENEVMTRQPRARTERCRDARQSITLAHAAANAADMAASTAAAIPRSRDSIFIRDDNETLRSIQQRQPSPTARLPRTSSGSYNGEWRAAPARPRLNHQKELC